MEIKIATVKLAKFIKEFAQDDSIIRQWGIKMNNGDVGYFETSQENQKYFVEGERAVYQWEPPEKERDENNKIVPGTINSSKLMNLNEQPSPDKPDTSFPLREQMMTDVKQKMLESISEIPFCAASHASHICASKGDFHKDEIMKGDEGLFNKLYDMIAGKMFGDMHKVSDEVKQILDKLNKIEE